MKIIIVPFIFCFLTTSITYAQTTAIEVSTELDTNGDYGLCIGNDQTRGALRYFYHDGNSNPNDSPYYYLALKGKEGQDTDGLFVTADGIVIVGTEDPCYKVPVGNFRLLVEGHLLVEEESFKTDGTPFWETYVDESLRTQTNATINNAYNRFMGLDFREYTFNGVDGTQNQSQYGVDLTSLQTQLSNSVETINWKGVAYSSYNPTDLFFLHMQATQELANQVQALRVGSKRVGNEEEIAAFEQEEITKLKKENELMKGQLSKLEKELKEIKQLLQKNEMLTEASATPTNTQTAISEKRLAPKTAILTTKGLLHDCQPNPLQESATITYELSPNTQSASLFITNINGQLIKRYPLTENGKGQILFNAKSFQLSAGTYFYSLEVDGEKVDTKQMIFVD